MSRVIIAKDKLNRNVPWSMEPDLVKEVSQVAQSLNERSASAYVRRLILEDFARIKQQREVVNCSRNE